MRTRIVGGCLVAGFAFSLAGCAGTRAQTRDFAIAREEQAIVRYVDAHDDAALQLLGASFTRAGHLVAEHRGGGAATGPKILLIGHLDTVFEPDSPFQKFARIGPTAARGPGIIDMKGGDVIIISSLKALDAAGVLKAMDVTVVMTGDEEDLDLRCDRSTV